MGISRYRYLHYDVFTERRFGGNQLAVFPDAAGLSANTMQQIAREIGFAETTFVTAAERPDTDVRMRIFPPGTEMPMAGHPVVGSTFALAREGAIASGRADWMFGLNIGPTPVSLEWTGSRLAFAWMTQRNPEFGATIDDPVRVAAALGVREEDVRATGLPVQHVSCGMPFVFVPLASREAVDRATPDTRLLDFEAYLFTTDRSGATDSATTYSRMFAPLLGVYEDPATGGASGPLGSYLVRHSLVSDLQARSILNLQGVKLGRPSWIHVSIESVDRNITRVRVGGTSVFVAEGTMEIDLD
ncbi:MAG TPA: PhzF family phenazine biosynthesis protein [Vicinamibacterales bacterium]|nr:PhzF family phenazine biosynthesis protein [Vicinamibacterales bacterium]